MTKATTNHYFNTGFPDDPILLDPNMVVRTDVDSVSKIVHACTILLTESTSVLTTIFGSSKIGSSGNPVLK